MFKPSIISENSYTPMYIDSYKISKYFFWFLWILYSTVYLTKQCYSAAMASIVAEGVLTKSQTGTISAVFYLFYAPLQIIGGMWADKYNPQLLIKISLIGAGIVNTVIFLNQNYYVMLIAWALNAVVQFPLWPCLFKIICSQLSPKYSKKGIFYISLSSTFGLILSYIVAAMVSRWQYNFLISAISLFLLFILFHIADKRVKKHMVPFDDTAYETENAKTFVKPIQLRIPTKKLFLMSGFFIMLLITVLRTIIENGTKQLAPTMLMENYDYILPSIGNLLNVFIIASGTVGMFFWKRFFFPKRIHNEINGHLLLFLLALPFVSALFLIGKLNAVAIVIALCAISFVLTGTHYLSSRISSSFGKFGKDGLAAGVNNAASSSAIMLQNFILLRIADSAGWSAVIIMWVAMTVLVAVLCAILLPRWTKFKKLKVFNNNDK